MRLQQAPFRYLAHGALSLNRRKVFRYRLQYQSKRLFVYSLLLWQAHNKPLFARANIVQLALRHSRAHEK